MGRAERAVIDKGAARARLRAASALAAALACIGAASAQVTSCPLTDRACIDQEYPNVCFEADRELRLEPCLEWLHEIEQSPSKDVRSSAAAIYGLISDDPAASQVRAHLDERRAELIRGVLAEDPKHVDALLGFAGLAETNEERVRRFRDVVAVDPSPMHLQFLASALRQIDGGALEAAQVTERAYEVGRSKNEYSWRFARDAIWQYQWAGAPERAEQLRERAAADFGLAAMLEEAAKPAAADPAGLDRTLQVLCREMTLTVFGARPCLDSIDHLIAAADRAQVPGTSPLEQTLEAAMTTAAQPGSRLDTADSGWRHRFEAALDRHVGAEAVARLQRVPSLITLE